MTNPTDEIVQRLRDLAAWAPDDDPDEGFLLAAEAADEIERLRALTDPDLTVRDLEMKMRDGTVDLRAVMGDEGGSPAMRFVGALMLHALLGDGDEPVEPPNYLSCEMALKPAGEVDPIRAYVEIIKPDGRSSHEIRRDLEARVADLEARVSGSTGGASDGR